MGLEIKWTSRAESNLDHLLEYLESEWCTAVEQAFLDKLKDFLVLLAEFPKLGSVEVEEKGIRGFRLMKQLTVFYRIKNDTIIILIILGLFDTRQDPAKKLE